MVDNDPLRSLPHQIHDAPFMRLQDPTLLERFLHHAGIAVTANRPMMIRQIATAFSALPYENLTKIVKRDAVTNARSAMRYPDEVITDWLVKGTGGTCFSLTAAIVSVYDALGIEAHPLLADRHYGPDTHCGMVIADGAGLHLLDPGYLLFTPILLPSTTKTSVETGSNRIELIPVEAGKKVELWTAMSGNRKHRLTYKVALVDDGAFGRAWENSFAWEMMTYPVLTRRTEGSDIYLQGNQLRIRSEGRSRKSVLSAEEIGRFVHHDIGIDKNLVARALEIIGNGINNATASR